jgi:hypothetical protein
MGVEQTVSPTIVEPVTPAARPDGRSPSVGPTRGRATLTAGLRVALSGIAGLMLLGGLLAALLAGGLLIGPTVGVAAYDTDAPPRRPPIIPPSVPLGAREDWAVWTYVDKINQAWGKDWPLVIEWFEDLDARYPNNPMVYDKLYAAYVEDGRTLQSRGDLEGARRRYEQAARYDPDRGVAQDYLAQLDQLQRTGR